MGASFDYRVIEAETFEEAVKKFEAAQEQDRYENGNSYSGTIGMLRGVDKVSKIFETKMEAYKYVDENSEKWESALAVKFKSKEKLLWLIGGCCES